MKKLMLIATTALIACQPPQSNFQRSGEAKAAAEGIDRGNGADYIPYFGNHGAWFPGEDKSFKYCIRVSPKSGVSLAQAQEAITDSITQWREYTKQHADGGNLYISFNAQLSESCDDVDLKVYFGRDFPEVQRVATPLSLGAAIRTEHDEWTGWGKGFLWITDEDSVDPVQYDRKPGKKYPDWSKPNHLNALVRHEFGHIFGTVHIPQTIMDDNIAAQILLGFVEPPKGIDDRRMLIAPVKPYEGSFGFASQRTEIFKLLFGRDPVGKIHAVDNVDGAITVRDDQGEEEIEIEGYEDAEAVGEMYSVLLTSRKNPDGLYYDHSWTHAASSQLVTLHTSTGASFVGTLESNMGSITIQEKGSHLLHGATGVVLKILHDKQIKLIFGSHVD